MSHLFGPVPSRRLGRSLGVDLVPRKTCPYDCIYCEVGPTTQKTITRLDYQADEIMAELAAYLHQGPPPLDYITLAGSGEPTLNLGLGRIIRHLKALTGTPVAVLTNGALLYLPEVRDELKAADLVLPSLDAAREESFRAINRPSAGLPFKQTDRRPGSLPAGIRRANLAGGPAAPGTERLGSGPGSPAPGP